MGASLRQRSRLVSIGVMVGLLAVTLLASQVIAKPADGPNTGPLPDGCVKIEGRDIGSSTGVRVNGTTVKITDWEAKDGGDYIGFHWSSNGPIDVWVKAGNDTYHDTGGNTEGWFEVPATENPQGKPVVKGISNVVFCVSTYEPTRP